MHFETICRICLQEGSMTSIYNTDKLIGDISYSCIEMLTACATVTVCKNDGFPQQICQSCYGSLCSAFQFRRLCESSFSFLVEYSTKKVNLDIIKKEKCDVFDINTFNIDIKDVKEEKDIVKSDIDEKMKIDDAALSSFEDYQNESIPERLPRKRKRIKKAWRKLHKNKMKLSEESQLKRKPFKELLSCPFCPKTFKWNYLLITHQDTHIGIKRYFCEICKKYYRSEKDHTNMHKRGFNFKCEQCTKCFNTKAKLTIHIETHSKDREKFACVEDGCGRIFLTQGGLFRHRLFHSGTKNFICHLCSKSFVDKYQLEVHIKTHTNDRNYLCGYCEKTFITSSARTSHERWHTKTKNHVCKYCEKGFVSSSGLKRHILIHSKEQTNRCRFCSKKFSRLDNKKRHEIAMHGVSEEKNGIYI